MSDAKSTSPISRCLSIPPVSRISTLPLCLLLSNMSRPTSELLPTDEYRIHWHRSCFALRRHRRRRRDSVFSQSEIDEVATRGERPGRRSVGKISGAQGCAGAFQELSGSVG